VNGLSQFAQQKAGGRTQGEASGRGGELRIASDEEVQDGRDLPVKPAGGAKDELARGRVFQHGGNFDVDATVGDGEGGCTLTAPDVVPEEARHAATEVAEGADSRRRERRDETLEGVGAHVDALALGRRRGRDRKQRGDRPRLHEVETPPGQRRLDVLWRAVM